MVNTQPSPVHLRFGKFDGTPHWRSDARLLGRDEFGLWCGAGPGAVFERPGARVVVPTAWVSLVPTERRFVLTRYATGEPEHAEFYLDLTTVPEVERSATDEALVVRAVDLDLDVIKRFGEAAAWIDDEDEFAEHSRRWRYPADLMDATRAEAGRLTLEVSAGTEPFDRVSLAWLDRVSG